MLEETTNSIIKETGNITRIKMSSGAIRTCAFLIKEETDYAIIDCGLSEHTVRNQLLPALQRLNIPLDRIRRLFITHSHIDHVGGMNCLLDCLPWVEVYAQDSIPQHTSPLTEGMVIHSLQAVYLPGHTTDCFGFLDLRTNSLISGDAIQLWGIEQFGVYAEAPVEYLHSHDKLLSLPIENIFSSHEYAFCGIRAVGKAKSAAYIRESKSNYEELISFVQKWREQGKSSEKICVLFENEHPEHPKMQSAAISRIIQTFCL